MQHTHLLPRSSDPLPPRLLARLVGFVDLFTRPTWSHLPLLLAGAILAPGRRTVTAALRILGRDRNPDFCNFHRILNRAAWSSRAAAGRLLNANPGDILAWFVSRWQVEVTFEEVRAHLGVETQRQWSDKAILRTTPLLLGLFSIVTLWANDLSNDFY